MKHTNTYQNAVLLSTNTNFWQFKSNEALNISDVDRFWLRAISSPKPEAGRYNNGAVVLYTGR